ncbi:hypothetical protein RND71_029390 [Anisodus tanguticus]|uniref:Uncharacterized protein n=1 Tax=Anisodus tanguticus TaxID=243964 RepID=A0AAE1V059_9SOLA|nr:hypothetical protein RND71_029390 [Anisodus tanguticus]
MSAVTIWAKGRQEWKYKRHCTRYFDIDSKGFMVSSTGGFVSICSDMGPSIGAIFINEWGEDRRFDDKRDNLVKLAIFWILQAIWVWTVSLPVTVVNASDKQPSVQAQDIIGWIMWIIGILVEITADQQKLAFKNSPENRGRLNLMGFDSGTSLSLVAHESCWSISCITTCMLHSAAFLYAEKKNRKYFLIFLWWEIFLASTPVLEGAEWLVVFGPVFVTLLLLFVSGIPLLEESADKKFGNVAAYRSYKRKTSSLILLPPGVCGSLHQWFKATLLLPPGVCGSLHQWFKATLLF